MAKRSVANRNSIVKNDTLVISEDVSYNTTEQTILVRVINKFPAKLIYTGQATGKLYIWENAGAIVEVDSGDVAELLTKKIGDSSCCGSSQRGNLLFELV